MISWIRESERACGNISDDDVDRMVEAKMLHSGKRQAWNLTFSYIIAYFNKQI